MAGTSLVSIRDIKEIKGIRLMDSGDIYIGAGTTFSHVTNDSVIQKLIPVLGEAVDQVGGPQVRNIGTIGGNVCNGAVSADSAPTLFSLNAMLRIADGTGGRMVPIRDFYLGPGKVDLHQGDVLTHIVIPGKDYQGYHGFYIKYSMRNAMDIATLSCSVVSRINPLKKVLPKNLPFNSNAKTILTIKINGRDMSIFENADIRLSRYFGSLDNI